MQVNNTELYHAQPSSWVVDSAKCLGIHIHKKFSCDTRVSHVKKANHARSFLQGNLRTCHPDVKLQCYILDQS